MECNLRIALLKFFQYLLPKDLAKCRLVCSLWKDVIDTPESNQKLWKKHCRRDYRNICDSAYKKSGWYINWYCIYRSLTLWSKFIDGYEFKNEIFKEIANLNVCDFKVLNGGTLALHLDNMIMYYDVYTLKIKPLRGAVISQFQKYKENDYIISGLEIDGVLAVTFKARRYHNFGSLYYLDDVEMFQPLNQNLYYVSCDHYLYCCFLSEGMLVDNEVAHLADGALSLAIQCGHLYIITNRLTVKKFDGYQLIDIQTAELCFHVLVKYNFLNNLDWRTYYHWYTYRKKIKPVLSLSEIVTIRAYGRILFVGYDWGVLHIYNFSYNDDLIKIVKRKPIKVYNLMDYTPAICPIIKIDVVEGKDSHHIIVATPKKLVVIHFKYF